MRRICGISTLFVGALLACSTGPTHAQITAYEGARLIVGNGSVVENATLIVDGARIAHAGADAKAPAGAKRVDLKGKTVMPMLIDTHVHLSPTREALIRDLKQRAYFGVSTAMSMGTDNIDLMPMRSETIPGAARFLSAGRGITMPEPGFRKAVLTQWINDPAEGRKAVQQLVAWQVDLVKIWVDDRRGKFQKLSPEIYAAIIDEAHKNGLRVSAHIVELVDAKGLIRAGLDAFAHGIRDRDIDDEMVTLFKQHPNVILTPNLPDRGVKVGRSWLQPGLSAAAFERLEKTNLDNPRANAFHGIQARNLAKLHAAGVTITMGTDGNRAWAPHEEMHDMVLAGMTPMQVIVASTRNGAAFLRLNDQGTLEAGKSADFIVLDANPAEDISNTRRISAVVLRGTPVDRSQPVQ